MRECRQMSLYCLCWLRKIIHLPLPTIIYVVIFWVIYPHLHIANTISLIIYIKFTPSIMSLCVIIQVKNFKKNLMPLKRKNCIKPLDTTKMKLQLHYQQLWVNTKLEKVNVDCSSILSCSYSKDLKLNTDIGIWRI